jgi:hypothetical protein
MSRQWRLSSKSDRASTVMAVYGSIVHVGDVEGCGEQAVAAYAIGKRGRVKIGAFAARFETMWRCQLCRR